MRTALIAAALTFSAHAATFEETEYLKYFIETDQTNLQEGAVTQELQTSNMENMLTNTSTKDGYYASLLGTKWSAEWMVWPVNNKEHCEGYCLPSPVRAQPYLVAGQVLRESRWNGRDVQVWTNSNGPSRQTFFMDKATGNPVAMQSSAAGIAMQYTTFVPASVDPMLPPACANVTCTPVPTIPPATGRAKAHGVRAARLTYAALGASGALHRQLAQLPRYAAPRGFAAARAVDSRVYATGVRNQGMCGGCWAFATAASTEIVFNKARNVTAAAAPEWLSVQTILDCVHGEDKGGLISAKGCQGGSPLTAMDFITKHGIARDMDYPFASVSHRTCRLPAVAEKVRPLQGMMSLGRGDLAARMAAVEQHGAFVVIINVIGSFEAYSSATGAVYNDPQCTPGLAHAVTVVGYGTSAKGEDYWIIKNSWTAGWGDAGYIYMARGVNMCGVEDFGFVPVANNRTTAH